MMNDGKNKGYECQRLKKRKKKRDAQTRAKRVNMCDIDA
jgi:hypothetical protein